MPFFDTPFKQTVPYNINVDNATGGRVAITILKIDKRDKLAAAEQLAVAAGARTTLTDTPASNIDRIILQVRPLGGNTLGVVVQQGTVTFSQSCNGDTDIVFETVP